MNSWVDFWNSDHPIYVNDRHKLLHSLSVGRGIRRHIPSPAAVVLDHGCGEALYAADVAASCGRLILCEAADRVREELRARVAGLANVDVIDAAAVERIADASLDLVIANSLIQYLTREELEALLDLWRRKLKPSGALIAADVIPPDVSPLSDALALVRFAFRGGFLLAAVVGLARTALSDYGKLRKQLGFSTYHPTEFVAMLAAHGLAAERVYPNLGHNQARMAFRARPV